MNYSASGLFGVCQHGKHGSMEVLFLEQNIDKTFKMLSSVLWDCLS